MAGFAFNGDWFKVISDGEKIVIVRDTGDGKREGHIIVNPMLKSLNISVQRDMYESMSFGRNEKQFIAGLSHAELDLSFSCQQYSVVHKPLIMGVDIFDKLSVSDYLDIINEKIKVRR